MRFDVSTNGRGQGWGLKKPPTGVSQAPNHCYSHKWTTTRNVYIEVSLVLGDKPCRKVMMHCLFSYFSALVQMLASNRSSRSRGSPGTTDKFNTPCQDLHPYAILVQQSGQRRQPSANRVLTQYRHFVGPETILQTGAAPRSTVLSIPTMWRLADLAPHYCTVVRSN